MLKVDNLEVTSDEFRFVLKYYRKHKKEFYAYRNDNIALLNYLSDLVRDYRLKYGYKPPIRVRVKESKDA